VPRTTPSRRSVPRRESKRPARISLDETRRFEELAIELAGAFVRVTTDKIDDEINRWLERIVLALGLNAFDAVSEMEENSRQVTLSAMAQDPGCMRVLVRDSGRGIEPDALPRIFDAFFTTKPGGMGMGLAISRSIVEAHGGRLSVSSNPGHGTMFEITLPCPT